MASAQEPGVVRLYIKKPNGASIEVLKRRSEELGPGGAPDHVVSANTDKWRFIPIRQDLIIQRGDKLLVSFTSDAADTLDASDCVATIPFTRRDGGIEIVTDADLSLGDIACAAGVETFIGEYEFPQGPLKFGGAHIGIFIEDDT